MIEILRSKKLYVHLALMFLVFVVFFWVSLKVVSSFTRHGESVTVPDLTGLHPAELEEMEEFDNFEFMVVDSVYDLDKEKGSIVNQVPAPKSKVKEGRKIYLTVVSMKPEQIQMPDLKDLTLRNATSLIETYGLKIKNLSYVPDIAKNAVVEVKYKGRTINAGEFILKGSSIDLVLGLGNRGDMVPVPVLIGKRRSEVILLLHQSSLNLGNEHFDAGDDTSKVKVYRQSPFFSHKPSVPFGTTVDVWYKSDKNFDFDQYLQTLKRDSAAAFEK